MQYNKINTTMVSLPVKRILTMTPYNKLIHRIDDLILDKASFDSDGYSLSVHDIDEHELGNIAADFLEYDDRDTTECFYQADKYSKDDDITCSLLSFLKSDTKETKQNFADTIRKNTIKKYLPRMQELIDERCNDLYWSKRA